MSESRKRRVHYDITVQEDGYAITVILLNGKRVEELV